ncbi:MAG: hypothetical protein GY898_15450 [Proteobacteria bacterium]|nr:hypothetical protein [Pseudomonadota bacterium]
MTDRIAAIFAFLGRQFLAGTAPQGRDELVAFLADAGFDAADIDAALARPDAPTDDPGAPRPIEVLQLSDDATRFLNILRDLGYLDDLMEDEVLDLLMDDFAHERARGVPPRNVELNDLRRHVATVLFDRQHELSPDTVRFLQEEWRVAFH